MPPDDSPPPSGRYARPAQQCGTAMAGDAVDGAQAVRHLPDGATAKLRLMGTTDLHANLLPYDYYANGGDRPWGLARVATLIRAARAEVPGAMLFDNGDALHGTPVGDLTTDARSGWRGPNPVIAAMNHLNYDAATLGNHEFNFGLEWLDRALVDATFPLTCANIWTAEAARPARTYLPPYLLLHRKVTGGDGAEHPVTVGVIGLVPPQITTWDHAHLSGRLEARDMVETARTLVPQLRAAGADIVLLLAHSGIDGDACGDMLENAALPLAALDGVDAIMAGHSHGVFPQPHRTEAAPAGIDHARGLLAGKPAVMAGACGSHLGILDLALEARGGRWHITAHMAEARPVAPPCGLENKDADTAAVPCDDDLARALAPAHRLTLRHMKRAAGQSTAPLHSYLALARSDASVAAVNAVQARLLARALRGTDHEGIPIVSATSAFKTGGRGGPQHFTDLPAGTLSLRHVADLYPFPNHLCGLLTTGAVLRDWLERAAICFATVTPGQPVPMLRDACVPGHDFDVISGLTYQIDLSQPPLYARCGAFLAGARSTGTRRGRIRDLRYQGRPVEDDAPFVLAASSYRAFGAGAYVAPGAARIIHAAAPILRDQLLAEIARTPLAAPPDHAETWHFAPMPGACVRLDTGPRLRRDPLALDLLQEQTGRQADDLGLTEDGFWQLRLWL